MNTAQIPIIPVLRTLRQSLAASEHARVIADLVAKAPALADAIKLSPADSAQGTD